MDAINEKELADIAQELGREVYGGKLNFGEVRTDDFITWYQARKFIETKHGQDGAIGIGEYDIQSVLDMFEEWVVETKQLKT